MSRPICLARTVLPDTNPKKRVMFLPGTASVLLRITVKSPSVSIPSGLTESSVPRHARFRLALRGSRSSVFRRSWYLSR